MNIRKKDNKNIFSYGKQYLDEDDIREVIQVLKSDWLTQGPKVEEFENTLGLKFGSEFVCAVSNGTAALHLTGLALGWGPDDIIITTPISFLSTANCILYSGAEPDFVDIDPLTYTIDPNMVEQKTKQLKSKGKKVKAVIAVDYAGHPSDWDALRAIAKRYELQLVNDNCHAIGASCKGDSQYAVKYADVATLSFHPVKHITTGEGGAVLTNNAEFYEKVELLRTHGMTKKQNRLHGRKNPWYYEMVELGYNYRLTDFQCALGISQMNKLDGFLKRRQKIAHRYNQAFSNDERFEIPLTSRDIQHAYHLYPLLVNFHKTSMNKTKLFKVLNNKDIRLQVHYIPIHLQPYYMNRFGFKLGDYPVAEKFYEKEISLPIYYGLADSQADFIVDTINSCIN